MAGQRDSRLMEALDRAESKKDGGYRHSWTFDGCEENEIDVEKDEAKLLSIEDLDEDDVSEQKPKTHRALGEPVRTYERRGTTLTRPRGNAIGLNMLASSKKHGENVQNIRTSAGTVVQGRMFMHANNTKTPVKTAAQRKEYPSHVQKVDTDPSRVSPSPRYANTQEEKCNSDMEFDSGIKRKVQQRRRVNSHDTDQSTPQSPHVCLSHRESLEQNKHSVNCTSCIKENKSKAKCQSYGDGQRLGKPNASMAESSPLSRPSIRQHTTGEKSVNIGLSAKNFYSSPPYNKPHIDIILKNDTKFQQCPLNGKSGLSTDMNTSKGTRTIKLRGARSSEPSDPIVLSSDDEDNSSTGSTNRIESISPRPADSACSSPAPSSGKVEAALKENSFILEHTFSNSPPLADPAVTIPRKAKMKDEFGNSCTETPVKRRKYTPLQMQFEPTPVASKNSCESIILRCRSVRIGTFCRDVVEPVVFCLDFIMLRLEAHPMNAEEIKINTSDLTKSEWCFLRKLPVIFFQTTPAACQILRSYLGMSREDGTGWYDCKSASLDEQYIVLIFEEALNVQEIALFEKILFDIGNQHKSPKSFKKINFDEANSRLVSFTRNNIEMNSCTALQNDNPAKSAVAESRMKLRSSQLQFFADNDEVGDTHTVFVGPIEKLFVYPPPPAKGGISVTNEDLHCLNEGEFLNDVIIDFYLKYLVLEKLGKDADRIHIFSSFFYKRLNQRERRNLQDTANLTLQQRRHGRVKTWTRHVDIFQKDFIFVPLNEAAHWFLAVICFPGLEKAEHFDNPYYQGPLSTPAPVTCGENNSFSSNQSNLETCIQGIASKSPKKTPSKRNTHEISSGTEESDSPGRRRSPFTGKHSLRKSDYGLQETDISQKPIFPETDIAAKNVNGLTSECKTPMKHTDGLRRIQISYGETSDDLKKTATDELIDSDDQDNLEESSDDGGLADENCTSEAGKWHLKPTFCKQPCILLMDSLRGPSRSMVVKTLREYLEVEWEVRKGSKRSFSKEVMKGSNPRVPQQNNFSDCGVYILQYVESFFESPIQSFDLPMNLTDWFPQQRMKTKREEIRKLILDIHEQQSKGQKDSSTSQPAPQEGYEQFISSDSG